MPTQEHKPTPLPHPYSTLWRISTAASVASLSADHFKAGIKSGAIPVEIIRIGRFEHVRAAQLTAWLYLDDGKKRTDAAPDCADLF